MKNRKEVYNPDEIIDLDKNSIFLDIMTPVGDPIKIQCESVLGISRKLLDDGSSDDSTIIVGCLNNDNIIEQCISFVCSVIDNYLDVYTASELSMALNATIKIVLAKKIYKHCMDTTTDPSSMVQSIEEYLEATMPEYGLGKRSDEDD